MKKAGCVGGLLPALLCLQWSISGSRSGGGPGSAGAVGMGVAAEISPESLEGAMIAAAALNLP